jgi:asparagine synthetase B (glutamine-hydrolysing)
MKALATRDLLGAHRILYEPVSGVVSPDLRSLLARVPSARVAGLDPLGVAAAWGLAKDQERTCVRGVRALPPGASLVSDGQLLRAVPTARSAPSSSDLAVAMIEAAARSLGHARRPIVALSGGLDAPLAVLAARRAGAVVTQAVHLALPGTSYDESREARSTAAALGLELHELALSCDELAGELPLAVRLAESPLYNLHPVSRAILARAAKARGFDALVTGDGADQAARGATEAADYVPIVAAITRGSGLALASPFLDDVLALALAASNDPEKKALRDLAVEWGLPRELAQRAKVAAFAPPLPPTLYPGSSALALLARALDRSLAWSDDDRANVGAASLAAFVTAFGLDLERAC